MTRIWAFPAGDGATESDGFVEDLVESEFHAVHFLMVPFVGEERGMEISVAHVAEGADAELVLAGDAIDEAHHAGEFGAWDGGILEDGGG